MTSAKPEYAGIATYLRGRFRTLNGPEDQPYAQLNTLPDGPTREEFLAASTLPDAVNKFLLQVDTKIDAILASLHSSRLDEDFPHSMEITSIGASNLSFASPLPLAPGDWLEVVVNFGGGHCHGGGYRAYKRKKRGQGRLAGFFLYLYPHPGRGTRKDHPLRVQGRKKAAPRNATGCYAVRHVE